MKKNLFLLALFFLIPFFFMGCGSDKSSLNSYQIDAIFSDETNSLECVENVKYYNNSENVLSEVCFFLYPNIFNEGQCPVPKYIETKAYINDISYGNITFSKIYVNDFLTNYYINEKGNILTVEIPQIYPNEFIEIKMYFTVLLANIRHRLGFGNHTYNFGNFFPIACVYEDGFIKNDFSPYGDPFYSDVSNFNVKITYPKDYVLASTGISVSEELSNMKTTSCLAENVRDFCFVLSKEFKNLNKMADGISVNYYYYDDNNAEKHLQTAVDALLTFNDLFGKYPYQVLNVVKNNFCFGGMEYPNLVMVSDDLIDDETINYVIIHEIAHQWWYGIVGNNEFENPWVDEGLTEYSTALFFEHNPSYEIDYHIIMENALIGYTKFVKIFKNINGEIDQSMNRNLNQFDTEPEYVNCTYTKGMLLFDSLRQTMSNRKFIRCFTDYFEKYKFKNSSAEKLVESFSKSSGVNLENFFDAWLSGNVVLEYIDKS